MLKPGSILVLCVLAALGLAPAVHAQTATLSGFVSDAADGSPLTGATVALYGMAPGESASTPRYAATAGRDGLFLISKIAPGGYRVRVSFIGYRPYADTLALKAGDVHRLSAALRAQLEHVEGVVVESERTNGAAHVIAGHQVILPEDIELVPSPDISADLVNYLTTLPGVVSTGDRGGQLFIRGGEPSQNLVELDRIFVYQPFHVLGFFSAFPADIIDRVDLYAGGYGSKFGGRLSSVIDVAARPGNNRRFAGMASVSPFTGAARLEGPIIPGKVSFLASARESFIDQTSGTLIGQDLPFRFGDAFGKLQVNPSRGSKLSVTALHTHDRGTLVSEVGSTQNQEINWTNSGVGARWLLLPRILPVSMEFNLSHSRHEMDQGLRDSTVRKTSIHDTRISLDATFFGRHTKTDAGWEVILARSRNDLGGLFQNVEAARSGLTESALYVEPEYTIGGGLAFRPGLRLQFYNVRFDPYLEPRLRMTWDAGIHHFSGALGLYHQEIVGLSDRRDAASVFTVWTGIPRRDDQDVIDSPDDVLRGRIGEAFHGLLGYRAAPLPWLEYSVEGFYKHISNLFVASWDALPELTTRLQTATGRSTGFEARVELRRNPVYAYVTYGYSRTVYSADGPAIQVWYGTESMRYRPPHDRRHQVNALFSTSLRGFDLSLRWEFGSGFPYTRPLGFDGFALVDDIHSAFDLDHSRRVIYERPFASILPTYHRLDFSIDRTWHLRGVDLTAQASAINLYDRRNIFYVDTFTLKRSDQLPFVPSLGLKIEVE